MNRFDPHLFVLLLAVSVVADKQIVGQEPPITITAVQGSDAKTDRPRPTERARQTYLNRIVAEPMSHRGGGASWLVRPERQAEENAEKALDHLGLAAGMTVCDLGCGNGYWTLPIARTVGETGKVYAVDIQPEMLYQLRTRAGIDRFWGRPSPSRRH